MAELMVEDPRARPRRRRVVPSVLLGSAAAVYLLWLAGPLLNPGMDDVDGYVSELAARGQPYGGLFRVGDVLAGSLAAAVAGWAVRRSSGWSRTGWLGLAVFGLATAVDAGLTQLDCAPSIDAECRTAETVGLVSASHQVHGVTSSIAIAGALLSFAGLAGRTRFFGSVLLILVTLASLATLAAMLFGSYVGVLQRVQLTGVTVWLAVLAAGLRRDELP
jgi:hypothetical protein